MGDYLDLKVRIDPLLPAIHLAVFTLTYLGTVLHAGVRRLNVRRVALATTMLYLLTALVVFGVAKLAPELLNMPAITAAKVATIVIAFYGTVVGLAQVIGLAVVWGAAVLVEKLYRKREVSS